MILWDPNKILIDDLRCLIPHLGDYILYVAFWEKIQKAVQTFTKSIAPDLYQRTNEELVVCKCKETENYQKCGKLMKAEKVLQPLVSN